MAVRIRENGKIVCAALNGIEPRDIYICDSLHNILSVEKKFLVTQSEPNHSNTNGEWWWKGEQPVNIKIDDFYLGDEKYLIERLESAIELIHTSKHMAVARLLSIISLLKGQIEETRE